MVVGQLIAARVKAIKNHGLLTGLVWLDLPLLTTDRYFLFDPPATAAPLRTPGVQLLSHCRQTPAE